MPWCVCDHASYATGLGTAGPSRHRAGRGRAGASCRRTARATQVVAVARGDPFNHANQRRRASVCRHPGGPCRVRCREPQLSVAAATFATRPEWAADHRIMGLSLQGAQRQTRAVSSSLPHSPHHPFLSPRTWALLPHASSLSLALSLIERESASERETRDRVRASAKERERKGQWQRQRQNAVHSPALPQITHGDRERACERAREGRERLNVSHLYCCRPPTLTKPFKSLRKEPLPYCSKVASRMLFDACTFPRRSLRLRSTEDELRATLLRARFPLCFTVFAHLCDATHLYV